MSILYPLRLLPEFHQRVWGSRDLSPIYPDVTAAEPIGEAWLTGDRCRVANGSLAGASLEELCRQFGRDLVGDNISDPSRFPLLLKFLFPQEKLSVQVHPDDEGAHALGLPCGKTECWYVLDARTGAEVALGLKPGTTVAALETAIRETRAEELLNWMPVSRGDMIYVDAGTVHAIGPGSILLETQQNSDTTFRLYDYGRPRGLHIEQGLKAVKERTSAGKVKPHTGINGSGDVLLESPCFHIQMQRHAFSSHLRDRRKVHCLVALSGAAVVECPGAEAVTFAQGEVAVIPAGVPSFSVSPEPRMEVLWAQVPEKLAAS